MAKREHENQSGFKDSSLKKININSSQKYCLGLCIHFQKKLLTKV